jgi:phenylacetate-coenzyme A ligase PaaK-like adenylate-forming protein
VAVLPFFRGLAGALWRERRLSREDLDALRSRLLQQLVASARRDTKFWSERLAHIDPQLPINLAQIQPVTKGELMSRFADTISGGGLSLADVQSFIARQGSAGTALKGRYIVATTSGTTGQVGCFVTDRTTFAEMNGALFARVLRYRLNLAEILRFTFGRRYRMAMTIATEGHFITRLVAGFRPLLTRGWVDLKAFSILARIEETVHGLNRYRPHYVHGYPSFLEALAHERMSGRLAIDPEFISLGSEPVGDSARLAIARAFPRAQIVETYGATECLLMANQCSAGRLHVNEDLAILEPVDSAGRPVPVGQRSDKVLVTNLVNRAQPLLRYELNDSVTILGDGCPCGSPMTSIRVDGRSDDTIWLCDDIGRTSAHPPTRFQSLFLGVPGLRQYQLVHEAQNQLVARFIPEPGTEADLIARQLRQILAAYLDRHGLTQTVGLRIEAVEEIPRQARGHKLRQIYSKVPRLS